MFIGFTLIRPNSFIFSSPVQPALLAHIIAFCLSIRPKIKIAVERQVEALERQIAICHSLL